jgi:hypothetical protein
VALSLGVGGGVAIEHRAASALVAVSGRVALGSAPRGGVEGSLWFVDGLHLQGELLAGFAWRTGRFELGGGLGVHAGGGLGPALGLTLRGHLAGNVAGYLRYDGALLVHDGVRDGQNATSLGVEAHF